MRLINGILLHKLFELPVRMFESIFVHRRTDVVLDKHIDELADLQTI